MPVSASRFDQGYLGYLGHVYAPQVLAANGFADLSAGRLEVAQVGADDKVVWLPVPDPQFSGATPTRLQVPESTAFRGGEGLFHHDGVIYFTTKGDKKVWAYHLAARTLEPLYQHARSPDAALDAVEKYTAEARSLRAPREAGRPRSDLIAEIAQELYISDTTVKTHITHILQKLNLRDRVQAVVLAHQSGLFAAENKSATGDDGVTP